MGRPKKIQEVESDQISEETEITKPQSAAELPLVMSIAELQKLTPEKQQLFRANGGTSTQN